MSDHSGMSDMEPMCDDPHVGCCIVEISVGINDPPDEDQTTTASVAKIQPHKLLKQIEHSTFAVDVFAAADFLKIPNNVASAYLTEPFLTYRPPPLYKTTERYRI